MFKFDFDIEDDDVEVAQPEPSTSPIVESEPFAELPLSQLLESLPPLISYSPLSIPLSSSRKNVTLARRDLFDARFQLISEGGGDEAPAEISAPTAALGFLDAPSDLVPGVYEGGLKTWECSLDLVDYLDSIEQASVSGKRTLEESPFLGADVGCGTGIPSVYLLNTLFCGDSSAHSHIHLQDYNASVLELITFPNIILAWYMSPSSADYRALTPEECPPAEPTAPGELPITPSLKSAFTTSLLKHRISLAFFSGSWVSFASHVQLKYDIVLTSETIYRTDALPSLIWLMHAACADSESLCLVAAKVLYFGVGGGVSEFINTLQSKGMGAKGCSGRAETVWERKLGVGRKIIQINW
ncbi:hypothetical protein C8R43DRAFT_1148984, partial [Mycena crocata]